MSFTYWRAQAVLLVLGSFLAASQSFAQDVRVETQQQTRTRQQNVLGEEETELSRSPMPSSGTSVWFRASRRPKMFTFFTTQSANFTSNAFLVRDGEQSDFYWNGRVGASFVPVCHSEFHADADLRPKLVSLRRVRIVGFQFPEPGPGCEV